MRINYKKLIFYIIITFLIGSLFSLFIVEKDTFNTLNMGIKVPSILFPIVWGIIYLLLGISTYMISESNDINRKKAIKIYYMNIVINSLWTLIFFGLKIYLLSFEWIIILLLSTVLLTIRFYEIKKISGILNIIYVLWVTFACYLNFMIVILN